MKKSFSGPYTPMDPTSSDPEMHRRIMLSNASEEFKARSTEAYLAECKTPGVIYRLRTSQPSQVISIEITLPETIPRLSAIESYGLEKELQKAMEHVLSKLFPKHNTNRMPLPPTPKEQEA